MIDHLDDTVQRVVAEADGVSDRVSQRDPIAALVILEADACAKRVRRRHEPTRGVPLKCCAIASSIRRAQDIPERAEELYREAVRLMVSGLKGDTDIE